MQAKHAGMNPILNIRTQRKNSPAACEAQHLPAALAATRPAERVRLRNRVAGALPAPGILSSGSVYATPRTAQAPSSALRAMARTASLPCVFQIMEPRNSWKDTQISAGLDEGREGD